jgi:hypothetical protein
MNQEDLYVSIIDKLIVIEHFDNLGKGRVDHYHDSDRHEYDLRLALIHKHYKELHHEKFKNIVDNHIKILKQNKHFANYDPLKQYNYIDAAGFVRSFEIYSELRKYKQNIRNEKMEKRKLWGSFCKKVTDLSDNIEEVFDSFDRSDNPSACYQKMAESLDNIMKILVKE